MMHGIKMDDRDLRKKAQIRAAEKVGFYVHFTIYAAVNLLIFGIWWFTSGIGTFPWFIFPLVGWGIGIILHFFSVFAGAMLVGKIADKEYEKLKKE